MSTRKYLLDEHVRFAHRRLRLTVNPRLKAAVHQHEPEIVVWRIGDPGAPPRGALDPDILLWCEAKGFSLVTDNRTSMPVHLRNHLAAGRHAPGIFILNTKMTMGQTAEELALIWGASEPDEYSDLVNFLPVSS
jgi:hypothetical protein